MCCARSWIVFGTEYKRGRNALTCPRCTTPVHAPTLFHPLRHPNVLYPMVAPNSTWDAVGPRALEEEVEDSGGTIVGTRTDAGDKT